MSANDAVVLTAAAVEGNGIALLPSYAVAAALRAGTLVRVLEGYTVPTAWMKALIPEDRAGIPRVRSLLTFLKARYSPVPPWDMGPLALFVRSRHERRSPVVSPQ